MQVIKPIETDNENVIVSLSRIGHGNSASLWWKVSVKASGESYTIPYKDRIDDHGLKNAISLAEQWDKIQVLKLYTAGLEKSENGVKLACNLRTSKGNIEFGINCSDRKNDSFNMEEKFPVKLIHNFVLKDINDGNYKKGKLFSYIGEKSLKTLKQVAIS